MADQYGQHENKDKNGLPPYRLLGTNGTNPSYGTAGASATTDTEGVNGASAGTGWGNAASGASVTAGASEIAGTDGFASGNGGGGASGPGPRSSIGDLMLGVLTSPGETMERIAAQRPVVAALLIVLGLSFFTMVMRLLGTRGAAPVDLSDLPAGVPSDAAMAVNAMVPQMVAIGSIIMAIGGVFWWFIKASIYRLLGEVIGDRGDGKAMLATLGFAALPALLQAPVDLAVSRLDMGWLSFLVGLGFWIWSAILSVLAIRASLRSSTGTAVAVFAIPLATIVGLLIVAVVVVFVGLASLAPTLP